MRPPDIGALSDQELLALLERGADAVERPRAALAALELAQRWSEPPPEAEMRDPLLVWKRLRWLKGKRKEYFTALYLDARNRLLHEEVVSIGTLTASLVHPREVFAPALERGAASVIVAHNHPSGDRRPSAEDRSATQRLAEAARILGIGLTDHVLVTDTGYFSFREQGLLR